MKQLTKKKSYQNEKLVLTNNDFNVLDDDFIPMDETSKDDYRMRVPAKNLKRFVKRFDTTNERENLSDLSREFQEELFTTEIFKSADFNEINYRYLGRHFTDIVYSDYNKCYELRLEDIVELIPTKNQEKILSTSQKANNRKFLWANDDDISSHGIKKGTKK